MPKRILRTVAIAATAFLLSTPASFALQGAGQAHEPHHAGVTAEAGDLQPSFAELLIAFLMGTVLPPPNAAPPGTDSGEPPQDRGPVVDPYGQDRT